MKICFVSTGIITSLPNMKRATGMATPLIKAGHQVSIVAMDCEDNRNRFQFECPSAIPLFFTSGSVKNEIRQKKKLIKSWNPDIVYLCAFGRRNWIHKFNVKTKSIFIVEQSELRSSIPCGKLKSFYFRLTEYLSILLFNGLICASSYLVNEFKSMMKGKFYSRSILYLPYAYNHKIMNIESDLYEVLKSKYKGKTVFLFMGVHADNYGFLEMIQAAEILKEKCGEFVLLMLGEKRYNISERYIDEHGLNEIVQLLGYIPENELSSYFKLADAFLSPLHNTKPDKARCPSKLFMYLPFQKPILTCKIGESFELFGEDGFYFEPGNPHSIQLSMKNVIDKKTTAHNVNIEKHSWDYRVIDFLKWLECDFSMK